MSTNCDWNEPIVQHTSSNVSNPISSTQQLNFNSQNSKSNQTNNTENNQNFLQNKHSTYMNQNLSTTNTTNTTNTTSFINRKSKLKVKLARNSTISTHKLDNNISNPVVNPRNPSSHSPAPILSSPQLYVPYTIIRHHIFLSLFFSFSNYCCSSFDSIFILFHMYTDRVLFLDY